VPRVAQVDSVVRALLGGEVSPDTRRVLLSGVNPLAAASDSAYASADLPGYARTIGLALGSPEFQRR
jgi:hypothetical protein